jgi:ATP-dependent Clp protease ATP-binding subunit ClpC
MFERFTEGARRSVVLAQEEARRLDHQYIGTEHLLLGLLRVDEEEVAARALTSLGLSVDGARQRVEQLAGRGDREPESHIPFTPPAKKILELSLAAALRLRHNYIGTEHILLGLVDHGEGVAAQVLADSGVDPDEVRRLVNELLAS